MMVIDLHEMIDRGDLEPKTSSYVRRPPFVERRVTRKGVGRGDPLLEDLEEELGEGGLLARVDGAVLVDLVEVRALSKRRTMFSSARRYSPKSPRPR